MLIFTALVQHTHALARTHSFFPSTRRTTVTANLKCFLCPPKLSSTVMGVSDRQAAEVVSERFRYIPYPDCGAGCQ